MTFPTSPSQSRSRDSWGFFKLEGEVISYHFAKKHEENGGYFEAVALKAIRTRSQASLGPALTKKVVKLI